MNGSIARKKFDASADALRIFIVVTALTTAIRVKMRRASFRGAQLTLRRRPVVLVLKTVQLVAVSYSMLKIRLSRFREYFTLVSVPRIAIQFLFNVNCSPGQP
jgi:hypothetical protein